MEGVLVSARKEGSNVTTTVVSNDKGQLFDARVFDQGEVQRFAAAYFTDKGTDRLYALFDAPRARFEDLAPEERPAFRSKLADYVRLYAFLSQVVKFADADLEKLYGPVLEAPE